MSRLLYGLLLLASPFLSASIFEDETLVKAVSTKIGVEIGVNNIDLSWGVIANDFDTGASGASVFSDLEYISSLSRSSVHKYQPGHGNGMNQTFSLRSFIKIRTLEDVYLTGILAVESPLDDAVGFRPSNEFRGSAYGNEEYGIGNVPYVDMDALWSSNKTQPLSLIYSIGGYAMFKGLGFGAFYETRDYSVSGHREELAGEFTTNSLYNNPINREEIKDHVFLLGFRAETELGGLEGIGVDLCFDYLTNFGLGSGDQMKNYYHDMYERIGSTLTGTPTVNALGTIDLLDVTSVHTRIHKLSVSLAFNLYEA